MDINLKAYERRIIEKDGQFLKRAENRRPVWYWSAYDAWWDQENGGRYVAEVAEAVGGRVRVFNPITGAIE